MTIEIQKPELEALIRLRMRTGDFSSPEELIWQALQSAPNGPRSNPGGTPLDVQQKSLAQLFAESPFQGLDLDFGREHDFGRNIELWAASCSTPMFHRN
jgi:hypothetical protein